MIWPHPVVPTSVWARRSIWRSSSGRSSTRITRRVRDSESLGWSASFEPTLGLFAGSTAQAVVTGTRVHQGSHRHQGPHTLECVIVLEPGQSRLRLGVRVFVGVVP